MPTTVDVVVNERAKHNRQLLCRHRLHKLTSERQTRVNFFFSSAPPSRAVSPGRRGTSIAGVLMLGLAVIKISLHVTYSVGGNGHR